jgi:hypothetical protein
VDPSSPPSPGRFPFSVGSRALRRDQVSTFDWPLLPAEAKKTSFNLASIRREKKQEEKEEEEEEEEEEEHNPKPRSNDGLFWRLTRGKALTRRLPSQLAILIFPCALTNG